MTKPTVTFEFATDTVVLPSGNNNKVEPSQERKDEGWSAGKGIFASNFNYLLNAIGQNIEAYDLEVVERDYELTGDITGTSTLLGSGEYVIQVEAVNAGNVNPASVVVNGTLTANGASPPVDRDNSITNNRVVVNDGEAGAGVTNGEAGFEIERGSLPNAKIVWREDLGAFAVSLDGGSTYTPIPLKQKGDNIGVVKFHPVTTAPDWGLKCNGQAVSRATYSDLFAVIGTDYGTGDGTTTFNLPDYRGMFMRGSDRGAGRDVDPRVDNPNGDDTVGSTQNEATAQHKHFTHEDRSIVQYGAGGIFNIDAGNDLGTGTRTNVGPTADIDVGSPVNLASENRPKNVYTNIFIRYK